MPIADGVLQNDPEVKAESLHNQYVSAIPKSWGRAVEAYTGDIKVNQMELADVDLSLTDFVGAVGEPDPYSSAPDWAIPEEILTVSNRSRSCPSLKIISDWASELEAFFNNLTYYQDVWTGAA